ncbi:MAG: glycosyltransferase [Fimbriimonadaceae bacterium]
MSGSSETQWSGEQSVRVLFMMANYSAVSETWLRRMIDGIREHVAAVAAVGIGVVDPSLEDLPHFELARTKRGRRFIERFAKSWLLRHEELRRFIKDERISHVFCHYGTLATSYLPLFKELDVPVFVHFHGFDATFDLRNDDGTPYHGSDYRQQIVELSHHAVYVSNSEFTKGQLVAAGVAPERIVVKHLGVEVAAEPKRHSHTTPVNVLTVGRLVDVKGADLAIKAFERAVASGADALFQIIGAGPMGARLEAQIAASPARDRITMLGALPFSEVSKHLQQSDIYIQHNIHDPNSNRYEAYGVSILEALAIGVPALVTRSGGVPEVVGDLASMLAVEPGDVGAQADMLLKFCDDADLRSDVGQKCWEWARDNRTLEHEAKRLAEILETYR